MKPMYAAFARIIAAAVLALLISPSRAAPVELIVPAYFLPQFNDVSLTGDWATLAGASNNGYRVSAILNPASGPGAARSGTWAAAAAAFTCDRCESLLGFTSTRYGLRPIAEVEAEIDAYYSWYPVTGIFLDELPSEADMLDVDVNGALIQGSQWDAKMAYYDRLYRYIKAKAPAGDTRVVGNPGTRAVEEFLTGELLAGGSLRYGPAADALIVFEGMADTLLGAKGQSRYVPTPWNSAPGASYADQLGYIVHTSAQERLADVLNRISSNGGGIAYVTDGAEFPVDQRYTALPTNWNSLLAQAEFCEVPVLASGPLLALGLVLLAFNRHVTKVRKH